MERPGQGQAEGQHDQPSHCHKNYSHIALQATQADTNQTYPKLTIPNLEASLIMHKYQLKKLLAPENLTYHWIGTVSGHIAIKFTLSFEKRDFWA